MARGHQQLLGLGALQVAELGAVAEGLAVAAAVVVAAQAGGAGGAGGVEAAEHAVADGDPLDLVARRQHRADELVADREARLDRHPAVVDVEVGAADAARLDADDRVVGGASSGSGFSSIRTCSGAWKVTARIGREPYRAGPGAS